MAEKTEKTEAIPETKAKNTKKYYEEKVKVIVPLVRKNQPDEIVGVNGKQFAIRPGVEVEVPRYIAEALERRRKAKERAFLTESNAAKNFAK